ncbi:MAG: thiamine phosphate synthase [bacterium]
MSWECVLDVNLNRLTESLKFLEDYIRFEMRVTFLLDRIRTIRSDFLELKKMLPIAHLIKYRKSEIDLGRQPAFDSISRDNDADLIFANFSRAKESARIIEEILRRRDKRLSKKIKKIRFQIYDLEKSVIEKRQKKFDPRLYVIIDEKYLNKLSLKDMIEILENNGATMIQLRIKNLSSRFFINYATKIKKLIHNPELKFIINDRVDIALGIDADGVHLGQEDIPLNCAREILGDKFIIGASVHNFRQAIEAQHAGADYLGIGAIFPTKTKCDARVCGLNLIRRLHKKIKIPIIGIGGINNKNYQKVIKAGASGIAIASYLFEGDLQRNIRALTL